MDNKLNIQLICLLLEPEVVEVVRVLVAVVLVVDKTSKTVVERTTTQNKYSNANTTRMVI